PRLLDQALRLRPYLVIGACPLLVSAQPLAVVRRGGDVRLNGVLHIVEALLELANPLPHRPRDLRYALGAEEKEYDHENPKNLAHAQVSETHFCLPPKR